MFYTQNSTFIPNIINTTNDQDQHIRRRKNEKPFKDAGNIKTSKPDKINQYKKQNLQSENSFNKQNFKEDTKIQIQQKLHPKDMNIIKKAHEKANIIISFSSDEEQSQQIQKKSPDIPKVASNLAKQQTIKMNDQLDLPNRKINNLLLAFSDQQSIQQKQKQTQVRIGQNQNEEISKSFAQMKQENANNLILQFQQESDISQMIVDENGVNIYNKYKKQSLFSSLSCNPHQRFYLQPVPENMILQCIIKRQKKANGIIYSIYDSTTLRNFMTILKDEDGYLMISNTDLCTSKNLNNSNQHVVARLISNFFGTQFSCYLCNYQFKKSSKYPINIDKDEQVITIEYQTNFFGFKGPRKMTAFIPVVDKKIVSNGRTLSEIYQKDKKKKIPASVIKFKNKTPKWNKNIEAYVLNFYGRATISSIKNFIMIKANENEEADARVLFGKFGKQLFNLDIRHPYNLIQGISLALSSFDKKLACQ